MIVSDSGSSSPSFGSLMNNLNTPDSKVTSKLNYSLEIREIMDQHKTYDKEKMLALK